MSDSYDALHAQKERMLLDERIKWMRETVRCETCRWFVGYCNCKCAPSYMLVKSGFNSCATNWEPKGES